MARNHDLRLLQLLKANLTVEEALIMVAYEAGINAGAGWSLLSIKRLEFMAPLVRQCDEYRHREWDEPLVLVEETP